MFGNRREIQAKGGLSGKGDGEGNKRPASLRSALFYEKAEKSPLAYCMISTKRPRISRGALNDFD
jgi:hypothetical protein